MTQEIQRKHSIIYRHPHFHAAFPSVVTARNGGFLVAFRRARDPRYLLGDDAWKPELDRVDHLDCRSHIAFLQLNDDLVAVNDPTILPVDGEAADQDPSLLRLGSGRLIQTGFCWYPVPAWIAPALREAGAPMLGPSAHHGIGYFLWGAYGRWSDDDGHTWSARRDFPIVPGMPDQVRGTRPYYGGALRGRAVERPDGTLLQATYGDPPSTGRGMAILHASTDRGETWQYRGIIAQDLDQGIGFVEPALCATPDGKLFAFHRTTGLNGQIAVSVSRDGGDSWEPWRKLPARGLPCDACVLPNGRVLLVYGRRHEPFGVRARWWCSSQEAFTDDQEIIIRDDAPSPDVGYPWAVPCPDGRVVIFYYIVDERGLRHIAATTIWP